MYNIYVCRLISFSEFRTFESLLCAPDVISQLAFKLFDADNKGRISFGKGIGRNGYLCVQCGIYALPPSLSPSLSLSLSLSPSLSPHFSLPLSHSLTPFSLFFFFFSSSSPSLPPFLFLSPLVLSFDSDNFKHIISSTTLHRNIPFDFNTAFVKQYFGQNHSHSLDYFEFSQLLQVKHSI